MTKLKFKLTDETIEVFDKTLHRIEALKDFSNVIKTPIFESKISIDKLLNQVGSKYLLVNIVSKRAREMSETEYYQMKDNEYLLDYKDVVLNSLQPGLNFMKVPTGGGKTTFWDVIRPNCIIIEPYGSVINDKYDCEVYKAAGTGTPNQQGQCI